MMCTGRSISAQVVTEPRPRGAAGLGEAGDVGAEVTARDELESRWFESTLARSERQVRDREGVAECDGTGSTPAQPEDIQAFCHSEFVRTICPSRPSKS